MGENTERIRIVAKGLNPLQHEIYFVGGAVVSLYADQIDLFDHRSTEDVDVLVEIVSRGKYMILQERLRELGFREDHESSVICRWKYQGVTVDIMPLSIEILGFSNRWYAGGIKNSVLVDITDNMKINIFSYPYFMASKFEALANRKVDWRYKLKKMNLADYLKPIGFTIMLIIMGLLLNYNGLFQNLFTIITIVAVIILIPLNQILKIKKIHIYEIHVKDELEILYQDILRDRKIQLSIKESEFENKNTNIRGCSKLKIRNKSFELNQYCNKYWSNEIIEKVNKSLNELKSQEA